MVCVERRLQFLVEAEFDFGKEDSPPQVPADDGGGAPPPAGPRLLDASGRCLGAS